MKSARFDLDGKPPLRPGWLATTTLVALITVSAEAELFGGARWGGFGPAVLALLAPAMLMRTTRRRPRGLYANALVVLLVAVAARLYWQASWGCVTLGGVTLLALALLLCDERSSVSSVGGDPPGLPNALALRGIGRTLPGSTRLRNLVCVGVGVGLVAVAVAVRGLQLSAEESGLSDLHVLGLAGILLAVVLLFFVLVQVARGHDMRWLVRRQLEALVVAVAFWLLVPIDMAVTAYNVARIQEGNYRPLALVMQREPSPETLPALIALLDHPDARVRQGMAAYLLDRFEEIECRLFFTNDLLREEARNWVVRRRNESMSRIVEILNPLGREAWPQAEQALLELGRSPAG